MNSLQRLRVIVLFLVIVTFCSKAQTFKISNFSQELIVVKPGWEGSKEGWLTLAPGQKSKLYDSGLKPVNKITWWSGYGKIKYEVEIAGDRLLVNKEAAILARNRVQHNLTAFTGSKGVIRLARSFLGDFSPSANVGMLQDIQQPSILRVLNRSRSPMGIGFGQAGVINNTSAIPSGQARSYYVERKDRERIKWSEGGKNYFADIKLYGDNTEGIDIEIGIGGLFSFGPFGKEPQQQQAHLVPS